MMVDSRFYSNPNELSVEQLAKITGATPSGDLNRIISNVASLDKAVISDLSFFDNPIYQQSFLDSAAGLICVHFNKEKDAPQNSALLLSDNPYKTYALASNALFPPADSKNFISTSATIDPSAKIDSGCTIQAGTVVEAGAEIGQNGSIGPNTVIKARVVIGASSSIDANVFVSHSIIGVGANIGPGSCIGQSGFGFVPDPKDYIAVPQLGRVLVGNKVSIGANCTIDRGTTNDTEIGDGCQIDNMVHIAHNVRLGQGCILAGQSGIAGSSILGKYVQIGGQAGVSGHLVIGDNVKIAAGSGVITNFPDNSIVGGYPAMPIREWHKQTVRERKMVRSIAESTKKEDS